MATKTMSFDCPFCSDNKFETPARLSSHIRNEHQNQWHGTLAPTLAGTRTADRLREWWKAASQQQRDKTRARTMTETKGRATNDIRAPFRCIECGKSFPKLQAVVTHNRRAHGPGWSTRTKKKKLGCPYCSYSSWRSSDVKGHMKRQHSDRTGLVNLHSPPRLQDNAATLADLELPPPQPTLPEVTFNLAEVRLVLNVEAIRKIVRDFGVLIERK